MNDIRGFRGEPSSNGSGDRVFAITEAGEKELIPAPGESFQWGHMGRTVGALATALVRELGFSQEGESAHAAALVQRHFLSPACRNEPWELSTEMVLEHIGSRPRKVPAAASVGAAA